MKTKLTALILITVMALQLTACGKKNDDYNTSSLPSETESIVETVDTPNTPDEVSTSQVSESTDTETKSDKKTVSSSSASKEEKKNSSSSAVSSKNTSSKKSSSAAASKSVSSKTAQNKTSTSTQPITTTTNNGGNNNTAEINSQNTTTTFPDPEPTPQPDPTPEPTPEPTPQPEPTPDPEPQPEPEPDPEPIDSPYARPFDVETIKNDMIAYGQERGLILDESLNIDNAAWTSPLNTRWYNDDDAELCFRNCFEEIDSVTIYFDNKYGDHDGVRFNVQIIEIDEYPSEYRIYVPYG